MRFLYSVLIAGCLSGALGAGQDEEEVGAVLEQFNSLIRQEGRLDALEGNLGQRVLGLIDLEVTGRLGGLDTLGVVDHRASINRAEEAGTNIYTYDIALGLENLQLDSSFSLKMPLFNTIMNLSVNWQGESLRLIGEVRKGTDGDCQASLSSAYVQSVGDVIVHVTDNYGQNVLPQASYSVSTDLYPVVRPVAQYLVDVYLKPRLESPGASQLICQYYSPL